MCGDDMARFSKVPLVAIQTREKCIVPIISTTFTSKLSMQCMDNVEMFLVILFFIENVIHILQHIYYKIC